MLLREARFIKRKTQYEICISTGIPQSKLSLIENGFIIPSKEEKAKIETALNIKIDWDTNMRQKLQEIEYNKKGNLS